MANLGLCSFMADLFRCGESVQRIEPARLGHVFVCSFGGSRYGISGCRRSYLSQRDLHAHIKRRHQQSDGAVIGAGDLSGEYAADLKRDMPAYTGPITSGPMMRDALPLQPVPPERPFPVLPPMVNNRPMLPTMPMEAFRNRPPAGNFPPNQGVVPRMAIPPGPPRIIPGDQGMMRPRFEEMARRPAAVVQQNARFPGPDQGEVRPAWLPGERDWGHPPPGEGNWMPPRSETGPRPHGVMQDGGHYNRNPPFY